MLTTSGPNKSLLTAFNDCKVKYMVVGGLAVKYYCANREVDDLDLIVSPTMKNACLSGCHPYPLHLGCSQSPE